MNNSSVPRFKEYFANVGMMSAEQLQFFQKWLSAWQNGEAIDVDGQISYLFVYAYQALDKPEEPARTLVLYKLSQAYKHETIFSDFCIGWMADCLLIRNELQQALDSYSFLSKPGKYIDRILSLKLKLGVNITSLELMALAGTKLTKWGREHADQISEWLDIYIGQAGNPSLLDWVNDWSCDHHKDEHGRWIPIESDWETDVVRHAKDDFWKSVKTSDSGESSTTFKTESGVSISISWSGAQKTSENVSEEPYTGVRCISMFNPKLSNLKLYNFSWSATVKKDLSLLIREAENTVREECGIPMVGEGWVSETTLYYQLREYFAMYEVIHHARPKWLKRQHLDIFIPKLKVAVEYQGLQHDKPVDFFGGEKAFKALQRRDAKKKRLCKKHKVRLIEARSGYDINEVIEEIESAL